MVMYGAHPDQLANLGTSLKNQIQAITSVMTTVRGAIESTTWSGPAHDQFQGDWEQSFKPALERLNAAFDAAGRDCIARSQDLERVMGAR